MINEFLFQVGDYKTYSKIDAVIAAGGDFKKVHFNFMESTFLKCDWSRPSESWDHLMKRRCLQLREKYGYLRLWFSGGWDSATVLDTFIKNNIRIDEIAIYDRTFFEGDTEVASAIEYAKVIKEKYLPDVKLSLIPIHHNHSEQIYEKYGSQWILTPGCSLMFPKTHRYFIEQELDDFKSIRSDSESIGNIWAHDKPKVLLYDNKWYSYAVDASMIGHFKTDCELFFCTPNMPELYIMQSHMAVDFFEQLMVQNNAVDTELSHRIQSHKSTDMDYQRWNMAIGRTHCVSNPSAMYGWLKSTMGHFPLGPVGKKTYLFNKDTNTKYYKIYTDGIKAVEEITGIKIPQSGDTWMPSIVSSRYFVRNLDKRLTKE